jgi:hypothetical protein
LWVGSTVAGWVCIGGRWRGPAHQHVSLGRITTPRRLLATQHRTDRSVLSRWVLIVVRASQGKDPANLVWYRQAEIVHARFAMLGVAGILAPDLASHVSRALPLP